LTAPARATRSSRIASTIPVVVLGHGGGLTRQGLAGRGLGIQQVGLAAAPTGMRVGLVDLHDPNTPGQQVAGEPGAVGAVDSTPTMVTGPKARSQASRA
jgi:hypothetical protein